MVLELFAGAEENRRESEEAVTDYRDDLIKAAIATAITFLFGMVAVALVWALFGYRPGWPWVAWFAVGAIGTQAVLLIRDVRRRMKP